MLRLKTRKQATKSVFKFDQAEAWSTARAGFCKRFRLLEEIKYWTLAYPGHSVIETRTIFVLDGTQIVKAFARGIKKIYNMGNAEERAKRKIRSANVSGVQGLSCNFYKHTAKPIDSNNDFECLSAAVANPLRKSG